MTSIDDEGRVKYTVKLHSEELRDIPALQLSDLDSKLVFPGLYRTRDQLSLFRSLERVSNIHATPSNKLEFDKVPCGQLVSIPSGLVARVHSFMLVQVIPPSGVAGWLAFHFHDTCDGKPPPIFAVTFQFKGWFDRVQ